MAFFKETRRLGEIGRGSFYLTLPKHFATYLGLFKGQEIQITKQGGSILLTPMVGGKPVNEGVIDGLDIDG